jgi:hypothetical protein
MLEEKIKNHAKKGDCSLSALIKLDNKARPSES